LNGYCGVIYKIIPNTGAVADFDLVAISRNYWNIIFPSKGTPCSIPRTDIGRRANNNNTN
jgi:hypothetical protein